jgi:2-polyprenyl-3-methyl-5-hydroxy-6-metoxy-1,4-benzoquinol methylase
MSVINFLKKIPLDLGQAEMKESTRGKLIAYSHVPDAHSKSRKALDIGCRDGFWSEKLSESGYDVTSIDVEPYYDKADQFDANNTLPYSDGIYDIVWCSEVIEHLKIPKKSIVHMQRVLKSGGRLILTTPNSYFLLIKFVYMILKETPRGLQNKGHLHFFSEESLKSILPDVANLYGYFPYMLLKVKIRKMLGLLTPTFIIIINKKK